tara:strand:+ start:99 stop:749 length:651 start_codon:yes stop_codon:yes gene_type:complete
VIKKNAVTIIDYGLGNLLSLKRALEFVGASVDITKDSKKIFSSSRVVLPGVGAYGKAMQAINDLNIKDQIISVAEKGIPFLGICLGMQLLLSESDEFGNTKGLNLIEGKVRAIQDIVKNKNNLKVPHIGWNTINKYDESKKLELDIFKNSNKNHSFYFVHSFVSMPKKAEHKLFNTIYGETELPAVIGDKNILGLQFHPEKSSKNGLKLLENFLKI